MKLVDIIKTANGNLMRSKGRSILTILAVFVGTFTIIATSGIRTGVNQYIDVQIAAAGGEGWMQIIPQATMQGMGMGLDGPQEWIPEETGTEMRMFTEEDFANILAIDGIQSVTGHRSTPAEYIASDKTDKKFLISLAVMPTDRINIDIATGRMIDVNSDVAELVLPPGHAEALGFESDEASVGQTVRIGVINQVTRDIIEIEAVVAGVMNVSIINLGDSWINEALADKVVDAVMDGMPQAFRDRIFVVAAEFNPDLGDDEVQRIRDELEELGFIGMTIEDQAGMMQSFFDAILVVFTIFGGIALLAASIGIVNTLYMAVQERTREIGLMKAMGLGKGKIFSMFSMEAIALGFWGAALGIGVAMIARAILNPLASRTFLEDLPGFSLLEFNVSELAVLVLVVMSIAFIAGTFPARRAAKKDPIEALRYE
ncbi:ABC transporter permease [Candidatus Saccharibacteria bacterium]|nr:ABC transporter permease [Candidatus Saccharibacteria bacterium]